MKYFIALFVALIAVGFAGANPPAYPPVSPPAHPPVAPPTKPPVSPPAPTLSVPGLLECLLI